MREKTCPVCISKLDFEPWVGENPSFEICPFCNIQFGYDDSYGSDLGGKKMLYDFWKQKWEENGRTKLSKDQILEVHKQSKRR